MRVKFYKRAYRSFEQTGKPTKYATVLLLYGMIGAMDYLTGTYSVLIFYVVPICLAAWFIGVGGGVFTAVLCGMSDTLVSLDHSISVDGIEISRFQRVWNSSIDFTFLLLMALLFSRMRRRLDRETLLARTDPLTAALNRRSFYELAAYEILKCRRFGRTFSIAYIDLDNFKQVNDRHGHQTGDDLLCLFINILRERLRKTDSVARIGGDEFSILMPETPAESARVVMEELTVQFDSAMEERGWPVSLSTGLITYEAPPDSVEDMVTAADSLMYRVKVGGKKGLLQQVVDC